LELPDNWDKDIPEFKPADGPVATRKASAKVLNAFAGKAPGLFGGSGDLAPSTKTLMENSDYFLKGRYDNRNIAWGVREHAMCGASSGIALHGGMRPYASTFLIFTDYARPAIRLASLMKLPVIYIMTHDSIGLGEDGPTHQPIEHLASLRAMPNLCLIRPADANEAAYAWRAAMRRKVGPTMLVLTRQNVPVLDRSELEDARGVLKGAYILSKETGYLPDLILIASGSEIAPTLQAQEQLRSEGVDARVVSMPSWELFEEQPLDYQQQVFPPNVRLRLAVEAASPFGWERWTGDAGDIIGVNRYGASAPAKRNFEEYGFAVPNIVSRARTLIETHERVGA